MTLDLFKLLMGVGIPVIALVTLAFCFGGVLGRNQVHREAEQRGVGYWQQTESGRQWHWNDAK